MSWECPKNNPKAQRNENIVEARGECNEEEEMNSPFEEGDSLIMKVV